MSAKLEPTSDTPVTFKNWRLVNSDMTTLLVPRLRGSFGSEIASLDARSDQYKQREMRRNQVINAARNATLVDGFQRSL
jgi:hypothetical protein